MVEHDRREKYAYLDQLSTSELKKILRADAESPESGDVEAIFYILEVIERREREHPTGSRTDTGQYTGGYQCGRISRNARQGQSGQSREIIIANITNKIHVKRQ